jgi:very-short-patch-repair endonuclease
VEVTDALRGLGGAARWRTLRHLVGWRALKKARADDRVACHKGVWTLVDTGRDRVVAADLRGVRSHATAAAHRGFDLPPEDSAVVRLTVPPHANRPARPDDVRLFYRRLGTGETAGDVTSRLRTVVDCLRDESLRVALSVGDSALRTGAVDHEALSRAVRGLRGPGSAVARARLGLLDARAANAFESCARALLLEAGLTGFEPQVSVGDRDGWIGRVDLADRSLRIVVECDGFETHGGRDAFVRDLVRFTSLVSAGWRPLRFTWEQVMFRPEWVVRRVRATVDLAGGGSLADRPRRSRLRSAA